MKALQNAVFRLMIPSLIFSAVVFVPKMLFHSEEVSVAMFATSVFGGISYWFTSALLVAQVVLLTLILLLKRKDIWSYLGCTAVLFAIGWYLNYIRTENTAEAFLPWYWKTGIEYTLLMALGGVYMQYEQRINARWRYVVAVAAIVYLACTAFSFGGFSFRVMGLGGRCDLPGAVLILAGVTVVVALCRVMKGNRFFGFIGQNSIVFYFFSGVFPAFVGMIAQRAFPERAYIVTVAVAATSVALAWVATELINRYAPFLVDLRKITKKK